jgi:hypothetical protein
MQDHSLRMLNNLVAIEAAVEERKGDLNLLRLAIVLHDVGVFYSQEHCHGPVSAKELRPRLSVLGLSEEKQDRLCSIIRAHDDESHIDNTPEAEALRILDSLDAFGDIGVYRFLEIYSRRGLVPPAIFTQALSSLIDRRESIPASWFKSKSNDLVIIQREFARAYDILTDCVNSAKANGGVLILEGFEQIKWDTGRIQKLLDDPKFIQNPFVKGYFESLLKALRAREI